MQSTDAVKAAQRISKHRANKAPGKKYAIYYRYKGRYYTWFDGLNYADKQLAIDWFVIRRFGSFDKIIAIYTIHPKRK